MLSKSLETQMELLHSRRNLGNLNRFVEPGPEMPMGKGIHLEERDHIRMGPIELRRELMES